MKKALYTLLAVSIIFAACKKEDEIDPPIVITGCTDTIATNYNATATSDNGSCIFGIVGGAWIPTSEIEEGHITATYMGINVMDSTWLVTSTDSLEPSKIKFNSNLTFETTELDGMNNLGDWLQNGNQLTLTEDSAGVQLELAILTIASVNATNLVLTMNFNETEEEDGYVISYEVSITLNFSRDLTGFTSYTTNQRKSNTTWLNKNKLINSIIK